MCSEEKPCVNCYLDQGSCLDKKQKQEFIDGLNALTEKTGVCILLDIEKNEMVLSEPDEECKYKYWGTYGHDDNSIEYVEL